jgi:hypothetical protein
LIATLKWFDTVGILASMGSPHTIKRFLPFPIGAGLFVPIAGPFWTSNASDPLRSPIPAKPPGAGTLNP